MSPTDDTEPIGDIFSTVSPQPAALQDPNQYFNALSRARNLVQQSTELAQLTETLEDESKVVIAALGGIGKLHITLEYCYQYHKKYPNSCVWWIDAARIAEAYSVIADTLHLPISSHENLMGDVHNWFSQPENGQWLFVLDNLNSLDGQTQSLLEYLPSNHLWGQIIMTSTTTKTAVFASAKLIEVDILSSSVTRLLIGSYLPDNSTLGDLDTPADTLTCIPLALTQASHLGSHRQYHHNQLNASYATLRCEHKLGFEMLNIACWFHRVNIPESVLRKHCQGEKEVSEDELGEEILPLMQYSFLEKQSPSLDSDEVLYCMDSWIQTTVQSFQTDEGLRDASMSKALMLVEQKTIPLMHKHDWPRLEIWLPHVQSILQCSDIPTLVGHQSRSRLLLLLGTYSFNVLSREDEAMEYLEASLLDLKQPGDISNCAYFLTYCYENKKDGASRAIELLRSTLRRSEFCSAPMNQAIRFEARFRCRLATLLCKILPPQLKEAQHEVAAAAELLKRFETADHSYNKLIPYMITICRGEIIVRQAATSYSKDIDYLFSRLEIEILESCERLHDIETPSNVDNNRMAGLLCLLGRLYMAQAAHGQSKVKEQKLKDAELSLRTYYDFCRRDSGDHSTWTLEALHELAKCLREQTRFHDMEVLLESLTSSPDIREQGKKSAKFLESVDLLSWVLMKQEKWQDAMDVCETFYQATKKVCGEDHHSTIDVKKRQSKLKVIIDRQRDNGSLTGGYYAQVSF